MIKCFENVKIMLLGFDNSKIKSLTELINKNNGIVTTKIEESEVIIAKENLLTVKENELINKYENKIVTEKGIINPVNNKVIKQAFQGSEPNFMNSDDVYFKNPQLAYETLIHNKDIHDIINNFRIDKQINSFKEKYIESVDIENKVKSMPKIKVTLINKKKKPFDDDDETKQAKAQAQALLEESLKKEIGGIVKANEFGLSREAMMQNTLELHGAFITNQNVRPSGRIFATLVITNTVQFEAILWGGVNSYKLEDLWKLRIIHEKNGNYININQLISINMNIF